MLEATMLYNTGKAGPESGKWKKSWFTLRGNKIFIYDSPDSNTPLGYIPMFLPNVCIQGEDVRSDNKQTLFSSKELELVPGSVFSIRTPKRYHLYVVNKNIPFIVPMILSCRKHFILAPSPTIAATWIEVLNDWKTFFVDDGTARMFMSSSSSLLGAPDETLAEMVDKVLPSITTFQFFSEAGDARVKEVFEASFKRLDNRPVHERRRSSMNRRPDSSRATNKEKETERH